MPTGSFVPSGPFSRNTWRGIESLPGQLLNNLGRLGSYLGSPQAAQDYTNLLRGSIPGRVGSIPPSANGESYRRAELRLADAARPGGGGGGGGNAGYSLPYSSPAAERAYQQEKSRVSQLTAQDPELQRYEAARGVAKTQEEMNAVRDEGMRIWAAKHGGLAAKVKPGSSGYEAIQSSIGPSTASSLSNEQVLGLMSFDPNAVLKTTQGVQSQFRPNQELTGQEILSAMSFDPNVAMKSAANMAYAPMSPAEAAMLQQVGGAKGEYITPMNATGGVEQAGNNSALFEELLKRATNKK
jgi:hypothetical protein